jgi:hypothetical protein
MGMDDVEKNPLHLPEIELRFLGPSSPLPVAIKIELHRVLKRLQQNLRKKDRKLLVPLIP